MDKEYFQVDRIKKYYFNFCFYMIVFLQYKIFVLYLSKIKYILIERK